MKRRTFSSKGNAKMVRLDRRMLTALVLVLITLTSALANVGEDEVQTQTSADPHLIHDSRRGGVIAAKGRVLGPNGQPIWAEFDADGSLLQEIGEAWGDPLQDAAVMSAHTYRTYVAAYHAVMQDHGPDVQVLSRNAYDGANFIGPDGQTLAKPMLSPASNSVVIRTPGTVYGGIRQRLRQS